MSAVARRTLHVARGQRRGADVPLAPGSTCVIGSSALHCDAVLGDKGVARTHCALALNARAHVTITALDAPVWVGQRELPPGASMAMPDFLPLRCGEATLLVGPEGSDWSFSMVAAESAPGLSHHATAAMRRVRAASPLAFAALLLGSALTVAGSVWGAVNWLTAPHDVAQADLARAQRWLLGVSPRGSELQLIVDDASQRLVVTGYVATESQREALESAMVRQDSMLRPEVVSVEDMLTSLARVARKHGLACEAAYRGAGRAACGNEITDARAAEELQAAAASRVAGLRELSLRVAAPAEVAKPRSRSDARHFAVMMSNLRGNQLIGPAGERWREGDAFDGMTIRRILFDQVVFERDRDEVVRYLAELR